MEEQTQQELETFDHPKGKPELELDFDNNFENSFDSIGRDLEEGCREIEDSLNNLDF